VGWRVSVVAFSSSVLRHGARTVRSGGLPFFFATLMTGLGLFSIGAYATLLVNFQRVASSVGESVAAVAFLDVESAGEAEEIRAKIALDERVRSAVLVTPEDALARARRGLGSAGAALEGSAGLEMPWVIEVTPRFDIASDGTLTKTIAAIDGVDEVMSPGGELERVTALMRLLHGAGAFLGLLIGLVVIVVVSNAVKITVYQRKDEIAIMKLVGATDAFVRTPFLVSGLAQGTLGALLGLGALALAHASLAGVVKVALSGALGAFVLEPMPSSLWLALLVAGAVLGVLGAALSVRRFMRV
jgi:cell division transport system permease protein